MKADKTVDVTVNLKGEDIPDKVGYYTRFEQELKDGKWVDTDRKETIFGCCDRFGYMSHMCYGSSYISTWKEFAVTSKHARKFDEFYFDAGGNGRPLYILYTELQRAMVELGLIDKESIEPCKDCNHARAVHSEMGDCNKIYIQGDEERNYEECCICAGFVEVGEESQKEDDDR